jgi:hypothetical protein
VTIVERVELRNVSLNRRIEEYLEQVFALLEQSLDIQAVGAVQEGYPLNSYFGYLYMGKIQDEAMLKKYTEYYKGNNSIGWTGNLRLGDHMYSDVNGDGKLDTDDLVYLGSDDPKFSYSFNVGAEWNGFDVSMQFQGVGRRTFFCDERATGTLSWRVPMNAIYLNTTTEFIGNTWTAENTNAEYPRLTTNAQGWLNQYNYQISAWSVEDAAYLRLKNLTIGYTLLMPGTRYWDNYAPRQSWESGNVQGGYLYTGRTNDNSGYNNQKWASERNVPDGDEGYDWPVLRYAEVLLNYAEAVYERDGSISDADLDLSLNLVRLRANQKNNMPKLSNSLVNSNGLSMREEIRRERTVELYQEGFRIDDLKRWATAVGMMSRPLLGVKYTGTEWQSTGWNPSFSKDADGCLIMDTNRSWTEKNYLLPLPTDQLKLNPNLKQNDGWQ